MWFPFQDLQYRRPARAAADGLYDSVVRRSRDPRFYVDFSVADTVSGRFDLLMLNAFLVFERLKSFHGPMAGPLRDALWKRMIRDMDHSMRELGVGDLSVGKKIKKVARGFYGRVEAFERGLADTGSDQPLRAALERNLYAGQAVDVAVLDGMARVVRSTQAHLRAVSDRRLASGDIDWPDLPFRPAPAARSVDHVA